MAHRVIRLSLSRSLVISLVLVLYQDTGQGVTITSCGFENANLCKYIRRTDDKFDWTRRSGATPTANTGPSSAYGGSYYLYLDTRYNNEGDNAIIQTKGLDLTGTACVSLAYHMYGEDIGTLHLWRWSPRLYLMTKTGNQGNKWFRYQERINNNVKPTAFLMEGIKGTGDKGDIALDDFSVVTGTCKTTVSLPYSCSFESDLCGMWQTGSDDLDWIRTHKANATPAIGSPGNSGGEWIISLASDGKDSPEVASIETPELRTSGNVCVRFKYYLSASNTCSLDIYQEDADSRSLAFYDSEATDAIWRSVSITVRNFASKHWITFSGRFSGGQAARIAVDEISISEQICNDCAIGNGGCNQTCTPTDTGRTCSCLSGYTQYEETGCQDTNECATSNAGCEQSCSNVDGSYNCFCYEGYNLTADSHNCTDIDECLVGTHNCSNDCQNEVGSYSCSCPIGTFLQDDQRTCQACKHGSFGIACQSQCHCDVNAACNATSGICPSGCEAGWMTDTCSIACTDGTFGEGCNGICHCAGNVACDSMFGTCPGACEDGWSASNCSIGKPVTLQPDVTDDEAAAATPGGLTTSDTPVSSLWMILAGVGLGSAVIMAVVVVVVVIIRRRRMTSPNDDHTVTYENGNVGISSAVTMADDPNNPPEAGVYQEINTTGYVNMPDMEPNPTVEYQNDVVYTKDPYQNLGSNREPLPDPYDTLKE